MKLLELFNRILLNKKVLLLLFIINLLGTVWGFEWYRLQLLETPKIAWPLVADSPTATLFFTITLFSLLIQKRWPLIEAFAAVTLFKYGIWACLMIIWTYKLGGPLTWEHYLLIFSHLGMALQAILFISIYTFKKKHLIIVAIWTIFNDMMDYTFEIYPSLSYRLDPYLPTQFGNVMNIFTPIGLLTLSLSIISLLIFYLSIPTQKNPI